MLIKRDKNCKITSTFGLYNKRVKATTIYSSTVGRPDKICDMDGGQRAFIALIKEEKVIIGDSGVKFQTAVMQARLKYERSKPHSIRS